MKSPFAAACTCCLIVVSALTFTSLTAARQVQQDPGPLKASTAGKASQVPQKPEDAHRLFVEAFNAGDLEAVVALYEPNAITFNKENQPVQGKAKIREAIAGFLAMKPHITLTTRDVLRSGQLAMLRSSWEMTLTGPDGQPVHIAHRSAEVVRRQKDGRWLYVIDNPFGGD
jgi:uncharacterized protein (TIGR02246 family)